VERLSGTDALFLSGENPAWHQHIGGLVVVDRSEAPDFSFESVRESLLGRLDRVPKYRWRIKEVPLHLDRPVWVDDVAFNIDRHLRRIAVPPPGGDEQVGNLIGQLMTYQLDRRVPLWEAWYIDGIAGDKVGLFVKQHHSLMDGVSGAGLAEHLFDLEPNPPTPVEPDVAIDASAGPEPSDLELLGRGVLTSITTPRRMARYAVRTLQRGLTMAQYARSPEGPGSLVGSSVAALNGSVGPRRKVCFASVSLDDVRRVRKELDVKVNDVVLALVAGSMRSYLLGRDELPEGSLVASVPVSTRLADGEGGANQVANMNVPIATDVEDPLARVAAITAATRSAKEMTQAVRARQIQSVGEVAPPLLINVASRAIWASQLFGRSPAAMHVTVSNIPGPPIPLYVCGARVSGIYAASVLMANMAFNVTCMSYIDRIDFGMTVDPDIVRDPQDLADGIHQALAELMEASGLGAPTGVHDPFELA
jgi:diacylglycerol O-acyltransferase